MNSGIFYETNLNHANLTNVNLTNINLINAKMVKTCLKGVNFSIKPDLIEHDDYVSSVCISPDGK